VNHARRDLCGGCSAMGIPTAIGLPRIIRLKENAPELDYSSFYLTTGTGTPAALCERSTVPHEMPSRSVEETALLRVPMIVEPGNREVTPAFGRISRRERERCIVHLWAIQIRKISINNRLNTAQRRPVTRRNRLCRQFRHQAKRSSQSRKEEAFLLPL
jgi:hypothetical protein